MTKTQTVQQLLNQFNLKLNLPSECLSLIIEGNFDNLKQKKDYFFTGDEDSLTAEFEYYQFEGSDCICKIIPDRQKGIVSIYKIIGDVKPKAIGKTYDVKGNISAIT